MQFDKLPLDLFNEIIQNRSYPDIVQLCLSNKQLQSMCSNPRVKGLIAERKRDYENVQKFIAERNPNRRPDPLHEALTSNRVDLVDELFRQGYNTHDGYLRTAAGANLNILQKLLEYPRFNTPKWIKGFLMSSINPENPASFLYLLNTRNIPIEWKQEALNEALSYHYPDKLNIINVLLQEPLLVLNQTTLQNIERNGNPNII